MLSELQGQIERITFNNEENGFTIAKLKVYGRQDLVSVVGTMFSPLPGEVVHIKGEWANHPKFGEQFKIVEYRSLVPATVHGIEKYLGSGLIKGIGPVMAKRIVKRFGKETLDVIEADVTRLAKVEGIGEKRIGMIAKAWSDQKEIRSVMVFLQDHGVSSGYATKIYRQYGNESIKVVQENPYRLAMDIFGIGFVTADRIAEKLGFQKDSELRAQAGILYVLHQLADEGHVYYPHEALLGKAGEILQVDRDIVLHGLDPITLDRRVIIEEWKRAVRQHSNEEDFLTEDQVDYPADDKAVYLAKFHLSEKSIASRLKTLVHSPKSIRKIDTRKALDWVQEQLSITLAERQIEAVRCAAENKVLIITGGPGTGKTTIVNAVLKIFKVLGVSILLGAPTGRAAKRMSEATGHEARTIHRMLEYSPKTATFQRNEENPLECDLLIVDEASMIDTILMHHLLKAIPSGATLILVGDVHQLPSVGAGNVLGDIIESRSVPVVELNEIFRQAQESSIIVNAHRINQGKLPLTTARADRLDEFYFIEREDPQAVLQVILELVADRIPKKFGFDPFDDIQVLTPMHRGIVGAGNLNTELQNALNPSGDTDTLTRGARTFRVRDKVMQIKNNYDKEVFNGDVGRVTCIDLEAQDLTVNFDGREVAYDFSELDELTPAYAVSIHKSQGSEYTAVVVPVLTQHYVLLQRNLIYTAVTRGRKLVVLVGTRKALAIAVRNNKTQKRYTRLQQRLEW